MNRVQGVVALLKRTGQKPKGIDGALLAAGNVSATYWNSCLLMRNRLRALFAEYVSQKERMTEESVRETARTMARIHFETTALHRMQQHDRDEQLLLMGDVIGRLFSCKSESEFSMLLCREWHW